MDSELEEIYRQVADSISPEEFEERVGEKVALMAGLCDSRTAAMLVARDLGSPDLLTKIGSIRPEMGGVTFTGRVMPYLLCGSFSDQTDLLAGWQISPWRTRPGRCVSPSGTRQQS